MALARQHPELFETKVVGVVLIATTAGGVDPVVWVPWLLRPIARQVAAPVLHGVSQGKRAVVVERARGAASDVAFLATRYTAFGDMAVSPAVVDFLERIIRATPIGVVAEFYPALLGHDERAALSTLGRVPVIVVAGEQDRLVPLRQAEQLAAEIPGSEFVLVAGAGHVVILERPGLISGLVVGLVHRGVGQAWGSRDLPGAAAAQRDPGDSHDASASGQPV
jgi:pimeloyl-ACP methyl ester carboxylesterase